MLATPAQTQRWTKSVNDWAKAHRKSQAELCDIVGYSNRSSWYRLMRGKCQRARLQLIRDSSQKLNLDVHYINGIFNFKSKFSEARNSFTDFKEVYAECVSKGQAYMASQIVRKAALFVFETLVPKNITLHLELVNRQNVCEYAKIHCSPDDITCFVINIYGGQQCVMFNIFKKVGSMEIPTMEGDLDIHAVSAIKNQINIFKRKEVSQKKYIAKFEDNAKKFSTH